MINLENKSSVLFEVCRQQDGIINTIALCEEFPQAENVCMRHSLQQSRHVQKATAEFFTRPVVLFHDPQRYEEVKPPEKLIDVPT